MTNKWTLMFGVVCAVKTEDISDDANVWNAKTMQDQSIERIQQEETALRKI